MISMHARLTWIIVTAAAAMPSCTARADKIDDEYLDKLRLLAPNDAKGHYELAEWCREKERWQLCADQCNRVLRLIPGDSKARLLRDIARAHLGKALRKGGSEPAGGMASGARSKIPRLLTDAEIQKIRRAELHREGPERARVHVDRRTLNEFFETMDAAGGFPYSRRDFFRLRPLEKVRLMRERGGKAFAERFDVTTDPDRIRAFERNVAGIIGTGCATSECHGGGTGGAFQMYGGRKVRGAALYTNFYVMHEHKVGDHNVIDRNNPEKSLLLTYGLPPQSAGGLAHPVPINPVFKGVDGRHYLAVLDWLESLALERPDYGIDLGASRQPSGRRNP